MLKLLLRVISLSSLWLQGTAQDATAPEFGFGSGVAIYQGDLSPYRYGSLRQADISFNLFSNIALYPALSLRLGYAFAALQENDKSYSVGYRPFRGFSFKTLVNELSLQVVFSPLAQGHQEGRKNLLPYVFGGAGFAFLNISRSWTGFDHSWPFWQKWVREGLASDSAFLLPGSTLTFPVGMGIRYQVGEKFSLFAEGSHRFTKEEYLDGFSKSCNPSKQDAFTTFTIGVIFQQVFSPGSLVKRTSY